MQVEGGCDRSRPPTTSRGGLSVSDTDGNFVTILDPARGDANLAGD
ncbi:hypothetical protein [Streptomyces halstedii]|uniref:Uncharacterized protein n=1 Tax=Streptomyces halstedii TaxID=1944 RepID=A0A6N9U0P0_STRHA|nr:hypothetical protein [Streptomyces halstedii]NEA15446.1 hypothetical protein [Streptomyces halstedii]